MDETERKSKKSTALILSTLFTLSVVYFAFPVIPAAPLVLLFGTEDFPDGLFAPINYLVNEYPSYGKFLEYQGGMLMALDELHNDLIK